MPNAGPSGIHEHGGGGAHRGVVPERGELHGLVERSDQPGRRRHSAAGASRSRCRTGRARPLRLRSGRADRLKTRLGSSTE